MLLAVVLGLTVLAGPVWAEPWWFSEPPESSRLIRVLSASARQHHSGVYVAPDVSGDEYMFVEPGAGLSLAEWQRVLPERYELRKVSNGVYALGLRGSQYLDDFEETFDSLMICRFPGR